MRWYVPKKWSNRKFAVYVTVTLFGGIVLILFLLVLGLLYWMNARTPLPEGGMRHPNARAVVWVEETRPTGSPRLLPPELVAELTRQTPVPVQRLTAKAFADPACPIQVTASYYGEAAPKRALALSVGRYPGQFYLVRRDLERRTAKGGLPFAIQYHDKRPIFIEGRPPAPTRALCIAGCSVILAEEAAPIAEVLDLDERQRTTSDPVAQWAADPTRMPALGTRAWKGGQTRYFIRANTWQDLPVEGLGLGSAERWRAAVQGLEQDLPALARTSGITVHVWLKEQGPAQAELDMTCATDEDAQSVETAALPAMLEARLPFLKARPGAPRRQGRIVIVEGALSLPEK